jgi:hypothetical protein
MIVVRRIVVKKIAKRRVTSREVYVSFFLRCQNTTCLKLFRFNIILMNSLAQG